MVGKKICIFVKMIIAAALLCFFTTPFSALAYNADYMSPEKWNSKNVVSADFVKKGVAGEISGTYKYFLDNDDSCFYICLNVDKSDSEIVPENIKIGFNITDGAELYSFAADQNGMCDSDEGTAEVFSVQSDFLTYSNLHGGRYICAVSIPKGEDSYNFVVSLWNNGRRYIIDEKITVKRISTNTKKSERTQKSKVSKSAKSTTARSTKFYAKPTSNNNSGKRAAGNKTVKTRPSGRKYIGKTAFRAGKTSTAATANSQVYDYSSGKEKMTNGSVAFLVLGIVIAVAGVGFIVFATVKNLKNKSAEENNKKDNNEEEFKDDGDFDF